MATQSEKPVLEDYIKGKFNPKDLKEAQDQYKADLDSWNKFQAGLSKIESTGKLQIELGKSSSPKSIKDPSMASGTDFQKLTKSIAGSLRIPTGVQQ